MAIGVGEAVAVASAAGFTVTTGSFTPAVGELLVVAVAAEGQSGAAPTISVSDSLSGTWTKRIEANFDTEGSAGAGDASVWTRPVSSATSMTVTMSGTPTGDIIHIGGQVWRVTSGGTFVLGATGHGRSTANNITPTIFTSTVTNSYAFVAGSEWQGGGTPVSSDLTATTYNYGGAESAIFGYKALGATGSETANLDAGGTGAAEWMWAALEVAEGGGTADVSVVETFGLASSAQKAANAAATVTAGFALTAAGDVVSPPSRLFTGTLEVELTAGNWTDITSYLSFRSGPVTVRQGRPTEYDDVSAGVLSFQLWNDDGRFMPGSTGSPYSPNWAKGKRVRWKVTHNGVTYTRFTGWMQAIAPDFPDSSTHGATVAVTATDALGLLAQRKLRSNLTEVSLWRGRADAAFCDALEASGQTTGQLAYLTNYSTDTGVVAPTVLFGAIDTSLTFGADNDMSIGGVVTASSQQTCKTIAKFQPNPLQVKLHIKGSTQLVTPAGSFFKCTSFVSSGPANHSNLCVAVNGSANGLFLRNGANTSTLGFLADLPFGQWVEIVAYSRSDNAARSDWFMGLSDGTGYSLSDMALDIRNITEVWFPGTSTPSFECTWGGVVALGTRTPVNPWEAFVSGKILGVDDRVEMLGNNVLNQLPVSISQLGTYTADACTGRWSDRSALEVLQEMMRTEGGAAWARGRDSEIYALGGGQLYPTTVVATIDTDADCLGPPRLVDASESAPTRVDAEWPGGVAMAVNRTAESGGIIRTQRVTSVAATTAAALAVAQGILDRADPGLRISQVTADLISSSTDHTTELLSESTSLGGLFPTQRIRLVVPTSHFGVPSKDVHVQGWQEAWGAGVASITMDTTPAIAATLASETWTGTNGAGWPAQWTTIFGGGQTGATIDILSNRGRIITGSGGTLAGRRMNTTWRDIEITGLVQVLATAEAQVWWRATAGMIDGYALVFSVSDGVRVQQSVAGVMATRYGTFGPSVSAGTDYRFRIRHQGPYLSIRAWAASGTEPGTWQIDTVDTLFGIAGYVSLGQWYQSQTAYFDDYTLTTGQ